MLQTFGDGIQVSVLKNNWQGANIPIQVGAFRRKWRQRQEVAGTFDSIGHLLMTVGTDGKETGDPEKWSGFSILRLQYFMQASTGTNFITVSLQLINKMSLQLTAVPGRPVQIVLDVRGKRKLQQTALP